MKKTKRNLLFTLLIIVFQFSKAQTFGQCLTIPSTSNQTQSSNECFGNNDGISSAYTITANSPTIIFNVSFHFINHPTLTTTYSSVTPTQLENDVDQTISDLNYKFQNIQPQMGTVPNPSPWIGDSKVRVQKAGMYIHTSTLATMASAGASELASTPFPTIFTQGVNNSIVIYFYWDSNNQSFGYYNSTQNFIGISQIMAPMLTLYSEWDHNPQIVCQMT